MTERLHLIGIGGIGMSAPSPRMLRARGAHVTGSDAHPFLILEELEAEGAVVAIGHRAAQVEGADRVVKSDAIRDDNPELVRTPVNWVCPYFAAPNSWPN